MLSSSDRVDTELTATEAHARSRTLTGRGAHRSDHFDGRCFFNPHAHTGTRWRDLLRWALTARPRPWPRHIANRSRPASPARLTPRQLALTFVNHITFLIQFPGLNILTDPVYSERVSPVRLLGPRRVRAPGLPFEALPPLDLVLISHDHYDHLDVKTLRRIEAVHRPRYITGLGTGALLRRIGLTRVHELDWWQCLHLPGAGADITFTPAQHWSGRGLFARNRTLWGGFHLGCADGDVYFAGDTGYGAHFHEIRRRLGAPDLALLPIGAYAPRWYEAANHMNPHESVQAHLDLDAGVSVATHFGCFRLSDEGFEEPLHDLAIARAQHGVPERAFMALETGETRQFSLAQLDRETRAQDAAA